MTATVAYQYVVLRCVAHPEREEFLNVGVVLYSQAADYLCAASRVDAPRLRSVWPDLDLDELVGSLRLVEAVCSGRQTGAGGLSTLGQRFGWLAAPRSTVLQAGPVHGGVTTDPARQLEHLLDTVVSA